MTLFINVIAEITLINNNFKIKEIFREYIDVILIKNDL